MKIFKRLPKCMCCTKGMPSGDPKYHFIFTKFYECKATIRGKLKDTFGASMEVTVCEPCMKGVPAHELAEKAFHFAKLVKKENIQKAITSEGDEEEAEESLW